MDSNSEHPNVFIAGSSIISRRSNEKIYNPAMHSGPPPRFSPDSPAVMQTVDSLTVRVEIVQGMSHFPDWKRKGEGEVFRGTHYLVLSRKEEGMKAVRTLMDEVAASSAHKTLVFCNCRVGGNCF